MQQEMHSHTIRTLALALGRNTGLKHMRVDTRSRANKELQTTILT